MKIDRFRFDVDSYELNGLRRLRFQIYVRNEPIREFTQLLSSSTLSDHQSVLDYVFDNAKKALLESVGEGGK